MNMEFHMSTTMSILIQVLQMRRRNHHPSEINVIYNSGPPNYVDLAIGNRSSLHQDYDATWRDGRLAVVWCKDRLPDIVVDLVQRHGGELHHFPVNAVSHSRTTPGSDWRDRVNSFLEFMRETIDANAHIRICCNAGRHRSGAAMALYLMVRTKTTFHDIKTFIRQKRPAVDIRSFQMFLEDVAQEFADWY